MQNLVAGHVNLAVGELASAGAADALPAGVRRIEVGVDQQVEHPDPGQLEKLLEEHSGQQVRTALDKLPPRARMALVLRYYSDMSYEEIADSLGVRRAFVGVLLLRARHQLRDALTGDQPLARSATQKG